MSEEEKTNPTGDFSADTAVTMDTQPIPEQQPYYEYPGPTRQPRQGGGNCGCWLAGLLTAFIVTLLVIGGLFLPPFNLGEQFFSPQYAMLDSQSNAAAIGGLTLIVDPNSPGSEFGVSLEEASIDEFSTGTGWSQAAREAVPGYLALQSPVYNIETTGAAPMTTTLTIAMPPNTANPDVLDVYKWDEAAMTWEFLPSSYSSDGQIITRVDDIPQHVAVFQATPIDPVVLAKLDIGQTLSREMSDIASIVAPTGMQPALPTTANNTLVGNPAPGFGTGGGYNVMPYIRNYSDPRATDPGTVIRIVSDPDLRAAHVQELAAFANAGGYDGLFIDYRDLPVAQQQNFSTFITDLAEALHTIDLQLGVVVPQAQNIEGAWQTAAYNWRAIGAAADYVQINFTLDPTTFTPGPDRLVEAMLRWAVGEVERQKLIGGLTALSIRQAAGDFRTIAYNEALAPLGDVQIAATEGDADSIQPGDEIRISLDGFDAIPGLDTTIQSPFIDYTAEDGSTIARMWLTTGDALRFRMDRLSPFGVGGVAFPDLLAVGVADEALEAVLNYKIQLPDTPNQPELVLNWRVESNAGVITEFTTEFNEEPVITLQAPDGNYAVNVEVVGGEVTSRREGAAVAVFAPTATPTPLPTATPTPLPTATPTLAPIVPTEPPAPAAPAESNEGAGEAPPPPPAAPVGGGAPAAPGAGSIGAFEYGGHVRSPGSARTIGAMQSAGMTWMKVQIPWGVGGGTEQAASAINAARGAGLKILLGVVGDPGQLSSGGANYIREYASFVASVAALGPDAIEIWNEPNLDREWPTGQISGANYTALLRESYNAIKAANSSVLVISGAPAPTGAENAFPGQVVNDDNFLRQMVESGAMNFMDCLGLHYNEGTVAPTQTSGDFRDNYYTRYLPTLIDTYWNITGGQKPICITELGYLSSEGYGPLPGFFAWAQGNTVAEQAAWLAQAAAVSAQSGRVQLMIVWNVDFENYGADPMAGYAIIRPDGSCPACNSLAAAR